MSAIAVVLSLILLLALLDRPRRSVHRMDSFDVPPPIPVLFPMDSKHPPADFDG